MIQLLNLGICILALGLSWAELGRAGVPVFRNWPLAPGGTLALIYSVYLGFSVALVLSNRVYSALRTGLTILILLPCLAAVAALGDVEPQASFIDLVSGNGWSSRQLVSGALPGAIAVGLSHTASRVPYPESCRIESARRFLGSQLLLAASMLLLPLLAALIALLAAYNGNSALLGALSEIAAATHDHEHQVRVFGYQAPLALILGASLCLIIMSLRSSIRWDRTSK